MNIIRAIIRHIKKAIKHEQDETADNVPKHVRRSMERAIKKYKADLDYLRDR